MVLKLTRAAFLHGQTLWRDKWWGSNVISAPFIHSAAVHQTLSLSLVHRTTSGRLFAESTQEAAPPTAFLGPPPLAPERRMNFDESDSFIPRAPHHLESGQVLP
jgi:hypothetical protein